MYFTWPNTSGSRTPTRQLYFLNPFVISNTQFISVFCLGRQKHCMELRGVQLLCSNIRTTSKQTHPEWSRLLRKASGKCSSKLAFLHNPLQAFRHNASRTNSLEMKTDNARSSLKCWASLGLIIKLQTLTHRQQNFKKIAPYVHGA